MIGHTTLKQQTRGFRRAYKYALMTSVAATTVIVAPGGVSATSDELVFETDTVRVVVHYDNSPLPVSTLDVATPGVDINHVSAVSRNTRVYELTDVNSNNELQRALRDLEALHGVAEVSVDPVVYPTSSNDTYSHLLWHLHGTYGIDAPGAWEFTRGESVRVAVLDTGHVPHPDLDANIVLGYDFVSDLTSANDGDGRDADPSDPGDWSTIEGCPPTSSWHGLHVAGTIAAVADNNLGVAGVAPLTQVVQHRVLGSCGGSFSDVIAGMRWAAGLSVPGIPTNPNPARIINMSLGADTTCSTWVQSAVDEVVAAGALVIVAAGNSNKDAATFSPASCNNVVTVAAIDSAGKKSSFSNYGNVVDIAAPGTYIASTGNKGTTVPGDPAYVYMSGTSMAAPQVAGVAALILSVKPQLSVEELRQLLLNTAAPFPAGSTCIDVCGAGMVSASSAVLMATSLPNAPRNVSWNVSDLSVSLEWDSPTATGEDPITGYVVSDTAGVVCETVDTSCTVSQLQPGAKYTFSVRSMNINGTGAAVATSSISIAAAPAKPSNTVVTFGETNVDLSWRQGVGGLSTIAYTASVSPGNFSCYTTETRCVINGLSPGTQYVMSLVAHGPADTKSSVVTVSGTTTKTQSAVPADSGPTQTPPPTNISQPSAPASETVLVVPVVKQLKQITVRRNARIATSKIFTLRAGSKVTWRVRGGCKIRNNVLVAPKRTTQCTVRITERRNSSTQVFSRSVRVR
jgi:serine protease